MIVVAGLSPAWQQVLVVDRLTPGAVNRASEAYWCGSGKVLNAALAAHHLAGNSEGEVVVVAPLGGAALDAIDRELDELGLTRRWVRTESPTRVCTTVVDRSVGATTELVENAGPLTSSELAEFEATFAEAVRGAAAVLFMGSLPRGVPIDYVKQLLEHVTCPAVLDVRGPELLAALDQRPLVVKPNREELAQTFRTTIRTQEDLQQAMTEVYARGTQGVLITSGAEAAWLRTDEGFRQFATPAAPAVVNPIGCGDALAGAMAWAIAEGDDLPSAVERGLAAAAANLSTLLPSDFDGRRAERARRLG